VQPQSDLDLILAEEANGKKILEGITKKVSDWQDALSNFFSEWEEYATAYRLIETGDKTAQLSTKTRVGEMLRSTEALTTSIFRMMTAADPPYDVLNRNMNQTEEEVYAVWLQLRFQDMATKWKRNLLRATRGLCLFGTQFVEKPWISQERGGKIVWEGLGFRPRSLLQCVFDPYVMDLAETPHIAFLDYMTESQLEAMAEENPNEWNPAQVRKAIEDSGSSTGKSNPNLEQRRTRSGYRETPKFEVCTYYGRIKGVPREDSRLWKIRSINESVIVGAGPNPSPTGELPFEVATYMSFELEPLGIGTGRLGRIAQRHLDENRRRTLDIARMGLMNMWLRDRLSGIVKSDLKIRPLGIVDTDSMDGLKALLPDLRGADLGLKIEELFRSEMQGNTGATPGLQASVTDASATEASIAQNEAIRRVSVIAEDIAESFVRDYQISKHEHNMAWLESDLFLSVTGSDKPIRVNRNTMAPEVDIMARVTTDKDFRPKRIDNLIKLYQILSSIRSRQNVLIDDTPIVKELTAALDVNPKAVFRSPDNIAPNTALNMIMSARQNAGNAAQELGPELESDGGAGGANMDTIDSPVGATAVSSNL
jgi:hypothetical protein